MNATLGSDFFGRCRGAVDESVLWSPTGRVRSWLGIAIEAEGLLGARVGSLCRIESQGGPVAAEVVGFRADAFVLMPLSSQAEVAPGDPVFVDAPLAEVPAGDAVLGRVLDGLGDPIDEGPALQGARRVPLERRGEAPLHRERIRSVLDVGIRAINAMTPIGRGSRFGIFAGSGVGKSTLLGQIAQHAKADVNVIALVGERGREVLEFLERDLAAARERSVVVVATSDETALLRVRAARTATAIAESFCAEGQHVMLLMDSLTRFCNAGREIGLASGEPPATRGYPPSVWSALPRLLERAGTSRSGGSITGLYTVLVEGDDPHEPVADAARSMLDGHIVLSRELAEAGHYPAIDVLSSVSRVMPDIVERDAIDHALHAKKVLASYRDAKDLLSIGAYVEGSDPAIDEARRLQRPLERFLRQAPGEAGGYALSREGLTAALRGQAGV